MYEAAGCSYHDTAAHHYPEQMVQVFLIEGLFLAKNTLVASYLTLDVVQAHELEIHRPETYHPVPYVHGVPLMPFLLVQMDFALSDLQVLHSAFCLTCDYKLSNGHLEFDFLHVFGDF